LGNALGGWVSLEFFPVRGRPGRWELLAQAPQNVSAPKRGHNSQLIGFLCLSHNAPWTLIHTS